VVVVVVGAAAAAVSVVVMVVVVVVVGCFKESSSSSSSVSLAATHGRFCNLLRYSVGLLKLCLHETSRETSHVGRLHALSYLPRVNACVSEIRNCFQLDFLLILGR
jgi:hypothetical protein